MSPSSGIPQFRADLLRAKRQARGWSCEQLAVIAGITPETARKAEGGKVHPSPRVVKAIAAALDSSVDELAPVEGPLTLRELRARRGVTQKTVATEVGVSTGMVSKVENGKHGVKQPAKWAAAYGVSRKRWTQAWEAGREQQRLRIRTRSRPARGTQ